jgi:hypothetical protein
VCKVFGIGLLICAQLLTNPSSPSRHPPSPLQVADEIKAAAATAAVGSGRGGGGGGFGKSKGFGKGGGGGGGGGKKKGALEEEVQEGGLLEGMPVEMALDVELPSEPR